MCFLRLAAFLGCLRMIVNNESSNTELMRAHNAAKAKAAASPAEHRKLIALNKFSSDLLDRTQSVCLNTSMRSSDAIAWMCGPSAENAQKNGESSSKNLSLISDADETILIRLVFKEKVEASQIVFQSNPSSEGGDVQSAPSQDVSAPRVIKVWANNSTLDFVDVDTFEPHLTAEVSFDLPATVKLPGSKFGQIESLAILVSENWGTEKTVLNGLEVRGFASQSYYASHKA